MRNDGTYFLTYQTQSKGLKKYYPPQVYPFMWQGIEFFVHKVLDGTKDGKPLYSTIFWQASHKDTGTSLELGNIMTITNAKEQAIYRLNIVGIDKVKEVIAKVREK